MYSVRSLCAWFLRINKVSSGVFCVQDVSEILELESSSVENHGSKFPDYGDAVWLLYLARVLSSATYTLLLQSSTYIIRLWQSEFSLKLEFWLLAGNVSMRDGDETISSHWQFDWDICDLWKKSYTQMTSGTDKSHTHFLGIKNSLSCLFFWLIIKER